MDESTKEIWKDVVGYEGLYQVSNYARIKRLQNKGCRNERILKYGIQRGYHCHVLCKLGKHTNISAHRMAAIAFIPNPDNKPYINHIDSDKSNNHISNLEWCTQKENVAHSFKHGFRTGIRGERNANAKLSDLSMRTIAFMCELGFSQKRLAQEYGVCQQNISNRLKTLCLLA